MIKELQWDSDFFDLKVGEIVYDENYKETVASDYDLVYVVSNRDFHLSLYNFENTFSETKVVFSKDIKGSCSANKSIFKIDDVSIDKEQLYLLAYESGKSSRFLLDKKFGQAQFQKLYRAWVDNSINKKFADDVLVYFEDHQLKGFVTYKSNNTTVSVGLIAVSPNHQGKGIGSKLLQYLENLAFEKGIEKITIPTQLSNIPACNFYYKQGYSISSQTYVKHYWRT